jgi:predicted nucleotidyltransferase
MNKALSIPRERMDDFCRRWKVSAISTSRPANPYQNDSELGVFIRFDPEADWSLTDRLKMQREFQQLSGRGVQLLSRLPASRSRVAMNVLYDA